jgi:amidohydrolase
MDISQLVLEQQELVIALRRDLHRIPELGFQEQKTSQYVADHLRREGLNVQTGLAGTGVVGLLDTGKPGRCLMIRSDMDALPLEEQTNLSFSSRHSGLMHACGHDGHMAMALAAVSVLVKIKDRLAGSVKFVFQPAEEGPGGAKPMIKAGVMQAPEVDYVFGLHLWPDLPEGTLGIRDGIIMAAMDRFDLSIIGKGGHGAMPHRCVDALEVGCQVVGALQRIVSRQMNPLSPSVVTVGQFEAGKTYNVIAEQAQLSGTTRTFDREIWHSWPQRLEKVIMGVCAAMGADYKYTYTPGYPPLENDPKMVEVAKNCAEMVVGAQNLKLPEPTMGGEDMAFFLEQAPGCFMFLGVGSPGGAPLHNPRFDFNEKMLLLGVEMYCRLALNLQGK